MCVAVEGRWFDGPHATFRRLEPLSLIKLLIKLFVVLCECVKLINLEPSRRLSMFNASGEKRSIRVRTRLFHPREVFNEFFNASTQDITGKPSWSQDFWRRSEGFLYNFHMHIDRPSNGFYGNQLRCQRLFFFSEMDEDEVPLLEMSGTDQRFKTMKVSEKIK